jgi:photosystem II reaction center protein PsbM
VEHVKDEDLSRFFFDFFMLSSILKISSSRFRGCGLQQKTVTVNMKLFLPFLMVASAVAFAPAPLKTTPVASSWVKSVHAPVMRAEPVADFKAFAALPAAAVFAAASPAFAESTDIVSNLPMATSLEVTFAAYLAVLLGTLLPTLFLIVLYLNSEARKIGDFTEEGTFSD